MNFVAGRGNEWAARRGLGLADKEQSPSPRCRRGVLGGRSFTAPPTGLRTGAGTRVSHFGGFLALALHGCQSRPTQVAQLEVDMLLQLLLQYARFTASLRLLSVVSRLQK